MSPRFDGYYLSDRMRSEDWHAGVCMVREYYRYLKLFADGRWLHKDHPTTNLDFSAYLSGVRRRDFRDGWAGRHPCDSEYEFIHQTGRFFRKGERLVFAFRHELIWLHEGCWELRVASPNLLVSESGTVFRYSSEPRRIRRVRSEASR
jgi:hypothetical protein